MSLRFGAAALLPVTGRVDELTVADVNGDGRSDVIVASNQAAGPSLTVLLGDGTGGLTEQTPIGLALSSSKLTGMAAGDWNGDGRADLAVVGYSLDLSSGNLAVGVSVLLGDGTGNFSGSVNTPVRTFTRVNGIDAADFNRDGRLDLALQNGLILLGNGAGGFDRTVPFAATYDYAIAVGDFNGDGIPDIGAVAPNCRPNAYRCYYDFKGVVLLGDGTGQVGEPQDSTFTEASEYAVADFNGDGDADLAAVKGAKLSVRLGSGTGNFSSAIVSPLADGTQLSFNQLAVGDFNQDGLPDLIAAAPGSQSLALLLNTRTDTDRFLVKASQIDFSAETRGSVKLDLATGTFVIRSSPLITGTVAIKPQAIGTPQNDRLLGNDRRNFLQGFTGDDRLVGLGGNDQLTGGDGDDELIGGKGKDTFLFTRRFDYPSGSFGRFSRSIGVDRILDFEPDRDRILLDRETFLGISPRVRFDEADSRSEAKRSRSYIVYVRETGQFYYNQNKAAEGFGRGGLFADLRDGLALSAANLQAQ